MKGTWLWLLVLASLCGQACSISAEDHPVALEGAELPAEALPDEPVDGLEGATVVYLVAGDRLQGVPRSAGESVAATVNSLLEGPRQTEVSLGLRSAIPAGTKLLGLNVDDDVVRLDLSDEFTGIVGEDALLALAQLIYTITGATSVDRVAIAIEGEPVSVAREDGEVTNGPVGREDYDELAPP